MLCKQCGQQLSEQDRFCYMCGAPVDVPLKKARLWPGFVALVLIFSVGFSVFLLTRSDPVPAIEDTTPWFTVEDGVLYFHADYYTGGDQLTVPQTVGGQTVTAIGNECFAYCDELVMIYLPETITHIGDSAFYGCSNLRGIRLPESLVSMEDYAFGGCVNLEAVCIPYSLKQFGRNLFHNCHKLSYFFYSGNHMEWNRLPIRGLPEDSFVHCADGIYPAK